MSTAVTASIGSARGRRPVLLGEVVELDLDKVTVEPASLYRTAGVKIAGEGLFARDELLGEATAYTKLNRLRADQLVYRKLTAWEGPITVVPAEYDGFFVSPEFPTFTLDRDLIEPGFLRLLCQDPHFHLEMRALCIGTAERRGRLGPEDLLSIEIMLPSLGEQQSIVSAASVLEQLLAAANVALSHAGDLYHSGLERCVSAFVDAVVPLSDVVLKLASGRSPRCEDRPPTPDEWAVLKVSSVRQLSFEPAAAKALPRTETPFATAEVRPGDLLTIRASGSARLVGAFCIADAPPPRLLMSDYHWRVEVDEKRVDPRYLMHVMGSQLARDQLELAIVGSTTAAKLSKGRLLEVEVPIPALDVQQRICDRLDAIQALRQASTREVEALKALRRALATKLLSGGRPAPDLSAAPSMS